MAEPYAKKTAPSPISQLLKSLGMTREDLVQHTEQMRVHLSQPTAGQAPDRPKSKPRLLPRPCTTSLPNLTSRDRSSTPPMTAVKSEPLEHGIPARSKDTMQLVMERKSRQAKRERRDSPTRSRDGRRVSTSHNSSPARSDTTSQPPATPHHYKYYSERVIGEASGSQLTLNTYLDGGKQPETPSRTRPRSTSHFKVPNIRPPKTPVSRHIYQNASSPRASTPGSSPARIVNIVSSPGPMRTGPNVEDEPEELPYTLPPGPYSTTKPDFSYAALIGQAILSSPEHRLTLQDIYEWITTVYPYYTRGEQTWMNSIRHSLSTMAVFRKVPRGRNEGKSLWAVWDCDLPCFAGGGFRKTLCVDMIKAKAHQPQKSGPKRKTMEDTVVKDAKKRKKSAMRDETERPSLPPISMFTAPTLPPFYAPLYPNAQQQPYYQAYVPQPLPSDVIFPPLPPTSSYHRALSAATSRPATADSARTIPSAPSVPSGPPQPSGQAPTPEPAQERNQEGSASSSVPDLVGNRSSSSTPPLSSEASLSSVDGASDLGSNPTIVDAEDEVDRLTAQWLASPSVLDSLEPLHPTSSHKLTTPENSKATVRNYLSRMGSLVEPDSPTMNRRSAKGKARMRSLSPEPALRAPRPAADLPTPPPGPCTPPRKRVISGGNALQLSAEDTPLSHRGLHMSPSPSLAYYKSHLDPPPAAVFHPQAPLLTALTSGDDHSLILPAPSMLRTPSRKRTSQPGSSGSRRLKELSPFAPITPKRLNFAQGSPYRTLSNLFDPHDPANLLDEELKRIGDEARLDESPTGGLFGKRSILYDSPGLGSPSRYW